MIKYLKYLKDKRVIAKSGLFDLRYYLFTYSDVRKNDLDPIRHYLKHGVREGRNPSASFDTTWYLDTYKDIQSSGVNPLVHYIQYGKKEGRTTQKAKLQSSQQKPSQAKPIETNRLFQALKLQKTFSLVNEEYHYTQKRMSLQESYLIDWEQERNKPKKSNFASIVIPLYGQSNLTDNCLESLFSTKAGYPFEVVLINNSQNPEDIQALQKWESNPSIKIVQNSENHNFALGCNQGFSRTIGDKVVFLNNDTTVTDNWLKELLFPLEDENISSVQPKLLYPDGDLQCMGIVFSDKSDIGYPLYQNYPIEKEAINQPRKFQAITAACLAIRAYDFALLQGFDTAFVNGQEDVDLCLRLNNLKNSLSYYAPSSVVYHYESKSKGRGKFIAQNRRTFLERWRGKVIADDSFYYTQDGYEAIQYTIDNPKYKELGFELYTPTIQKSQIPPNNSATHPIKDRIFCITSNNTIELERKTIMVSTHRVGEVLYGGQRSFIDMVEALFQSNYNVIVTLPNSSNQAYIDMLTPLCHKLYIVNYSFWLANHVNHDSIALLETIIKDNNIDALYVNTIVCRDPLIAAQKVNVPCVIHAREIIDSDEALCQTIGIESSDEIIDQVKKSADVLVCNSKATLQLFKADHSELIYNRINMDLFDKLRPRNETKLRFAIISGNEPKKGIFDFVEVAKACKDINDIEFCIIGHRNSHIKSIEQDIKKSKLTNLKLLGYYNNPVDAISECDVVLSLSHVKESFGRTVAEAMAAKKVVIGYDWGAIPELIDDNITGFICQYRNLDQVIEKIHYISNHRTLLEEMGQKGAEKIKTLCDTKIYSKAVHQAIERALQLRSVAQSQYKTTLIIPIYNAYNEVIHCIDSVINTVPSNCEILLINDCSPDKRIRPLLEKYEGLTNISIYHNEPNLGYTRNVNKAIKLAKGEDIVLLNSDTIVTQGWLENLTSVAYSQKNIGTVTAMSDNAGAFSFPSNEKGIEIKPQEITHNNYAQIIIEQTQKLDPIEVPTGSGFCLYIKGALLKDIGLFDEVLFPRGYGEENDFCLRAIEAGWTNVISTTTFVFHVRTASFKDEKTQLVKSAQAHILNKYPNYTQMIQEAFKSQKLQTLHQHAQKAIENIHKQRSPKA